MDLDLRLPAPSGWAWVAIGVGLMLAHVSAEGHGMTPDDVTGLMESSTAPDGETVTVKTVVPSTVALAWGTGPFPAFSERHVLVKKEAEA